MFKSQIRVKNGFKEAEDCVKRSLLIQQTESGFLVL